MAIAYTNLIIAWVGFLFQNRTVVGPRSGIDKTFLSRCWRPIRDPPTLSKLWDETLNKFTTVLSDQFIVTGTALLITAYAQACKISIYHFQMITWLAWIASASHQLTLTTMRSYLQETRTVLYYRILCRFFSFCCSLPLHSQGQQC